ncbi:hypothetical protein Tco_0849309 [Tanacetum coccineum]
MILYIEGQVSNGFPVMQCTTILATQNLIKDFCFHFSRSSTSMFYQAILIRDVDIEKKWWAYEKRLVRAAKPCQEILLKSTL